MATTKFEKPVGSETFQLQQQVSTMNTSLNALTTKVGNVGSTDLQTQVNTLNSNLNAFSTVSFTPESGITNNLFIRRYGRVVCINGYLQSASAFTSNQLVGYIQAGHRPATPMRLLAGVAEQPYNVAEIAYVVISNSGDIRVTAKSGNTYKCCYLTASYVVQD